MLILRRKANEKIILNDGTIVIIVLAVEGDRVKIGIDAPPDVTIVRDEVLDESHPLFRPRSMVRPANEPV